MNKRNRFTEKETELLKEYWPTGNRDALAPVLTRHPWKSIKKKSNEIGLTRNRRGHPVNESFFSKWSPEMAYCLGYTFADGSIKGTKGKISTWWFWNIYSSDKHIVQDISDAVGWEGKIHISNRSDRYGKKTMYRLSIGSKKLIADLRKLGLTQNKTKTMQPPNVPTKYLGHFMRGCFDGDGNIGWTKSKYISVGIGSASYDFIDWAATIISTTLGIKKPTISKRSSIDFWSIRFAGYNAKRWLDFVYKDATIFLKRKHNIYELSNKRGRHHSVVPKFTMSFHNRWSGHS